MSKQKPIRPASRLQEWSRRRRLRRWRRRADRLRLSGRHAAAFEYFARAALGGDVQSQAVIADDYLHGRSVPANLNAATLWFHRAASGGDVNAMVQMARFALDGVRVAGLPDQPGGSGPDPVGCHGWASRAAEAGSIEAKVILASILLDGPPPLRDQAKARDLLREAAGKGNVSGCFGLAVLLARDPAGCDRQEIAALVGKAAAAGLPVAVYLEGVVKEVGETGSDPVGHYRRAAELGVRAAQTRLGFRLLQGIGVARDEVAGETLLRKAALAGDATAAALVGQIYAQGGDAPPNYVEAGLWFNRAAQAGHREAATALGLMHLTGMGVPVDGAEAARWFQRARDTALRVPPGDPAHLLFPDCDAPGGRIDVRSWFAAAAGAGDHRACYHLGVCLLAGVGGDPAPASAAPLLRHAAERLPAAQSLYGQMLSLGQGIDRDETAARDWLSRAAASGVADAQASLAEMYLNGRGGPPDEAASRDLFSQAAEQQHPGATFALGILYTGQHRTPEDAARATALLERAAKQGHPHARPALLRFQSCRAANTSAPAAALAQPA